MSNDSLTPFMDAFSVHYFEREYSRIVGQYTIESFGVFRIQDVDEEVFHFLMSEFTFHFFPLKD